MRSCDEDQRREPMEKPNGETKWKNQMEKPNGETKWRKQMEKKKKQVGHPSGNVRHPSGIDSHPNLMWAVIHPVMIAIQINVHGQESIESVIPKTLNTFIESQSNLQCDIRQQYKLAVLRNHWSQIQ
ncbi:hypothetical protein BLOT_011700 [Blomia tropicalis]|nr:hypothetical protein BLOT_011700 [Blomia tropicalis]